MISKFFLYKSIGKRTQIKYIFSERTQRIKLRKATHKKVMVNLHNNNMASAFMREQKRICKEN